MVDTRVFVQIPAYRDVELGPTLVDLYARASEPARLRTCVAWQHASGELLSSAALSLPQVEVLDLPSADSYGCNWARRLCQERWSGEPFTLIIDSHHRFVSGWDDMLITMYRQLAEDGVSKPLLTAYLPSYQPSLDPLGRMLHPLKIYPLSREEGLLTRLTGHPIPWWQRLVRPISAEFLSMHMIFAAGEFNHEVPLEPEIYFFGDEVVTGLRAFTHGYDLFHPHRIVGWHSYARETRIPHWNDHVDWHEKHLASLHLIRDLFRGDDPRHLLGDERTVSAYEVHIMTRLDEAS